MSLRTTTICLMLALLLTLIIFNPQTVVSQEPNNSDLRNVRLFLYREEGENSLVFLDDLVDRSYRTIQLDHNDNITLSIQNVDKRYFNPDINAFISLVPSYRATLEFDFLLRCDGDGDGIFEYLINYPETSFWYGGTAQVQPSNSTGEPIDMVNGTIELDIWRIDDSSDYTELQVNRDSCFVQIPFDVDTDSDGISDFSDEDNDGDGYRDEDDVFPLDPKEWKDSDNDGIGDNADDDDNGNGIPDDLEIPLVMGIVLLPLVIIMVVMNKMKKKGKEEEEGEWGEEDIPILTTPHEGPKNW